MLWTLGYQIKNSFSKNSEKILDENLVNRINSTIENVEDKISTESISFVNEQVQNQYFLVDNKDRPSTQRRIKMSTNYSRKLKQAAVTKNQQTMKIKSKNKQSEESTDALSSINFFKNRKVDIKTSTNTEILPAIQDKGGSDQSMWRTTSAEISNLYQRVKSGQILKKTDKDEYLPLRFLGISKKWFLTPGIEYIEGLYLDLMISEMFLEISKKHILNDKTIHLLIQCIDSLDGLEWKILDGPTGRESAIRNYTFFLKAALFPLHILQLLKGDSIVNESNISEGLTFKLKAIRINAISAIYNCTIRNKWILTDERLNHIQKYIDDDDREFKNWIIQIFLLIENNKDVNYTKLFNECLKQFEQNENLIHAISYIYEQSKDMNRCKELFDENSITIISSVFAKQNLSQHEKLIVCSIINNYLQSSYSKGLNEIQLRNYAYLFHHSQDNEDLKLEALKSIVLTVEKVKMLPEFMMEILIENMNKGDDKFDNFVILVLRIIAEQQAIFKVDCLASKLLEDSIIIRDEIDISFEKASEYNLDCQWISSIVAQMFLTSLQKNIRINDQSIDYLVKSLDSKDKQTCILSAKSLYLVAETHEIKDPILFDLKEHIESRIHDVSVYLTVAYVQGLATLSSSYGFIAASHVSYLPRIYVFEDLQLGEENFANIVNKKILFLLYNEAANNPFEDDVFRIFDHILLLENEYQVDAIEILRKYSANKFLIPDDTLSALENIVTTPELFNQVFQVIENIIHNKQIVSEKILRIIADNFYLSHNDKLRESSYHLLDMANDNQDISEEIFNIFELEKSSRAISSHYLEAKCAIAYLLEKTKNGYRLTINGFRALAQVINIPWIIDNDILKILLNVSNNGQIIPIDLVGKLTRRFNPYSEQHDFIRIFENLVKNNQDIPNKLSSKLTKALNNPYILDQVLIIFLLEGQKEQYLSVICSVIETKDYFAIDTRNLFVRILYRKSIKNIIARIQTALVHALKIDNQDVIRKAINGLKILVSHHKVVPEKETIDILLSLITSDICNEIIRQDIRILLNISTLENNQKCAYELAYLNFDNYDQLLDKLDQFDKPKLLTQNFNQISCVIDNDSTLSLKALEILRKCSNKENITDKLLNSIAVLLASTNSKHIKSLCCQVIADIVGTGRKIFIDILDQNDKFHIFHCDILICIALTLEVKEMSELKSLEINIFNDNDIIRYWSFRGLRAAYDRGFRSSAFLQWCNHIIDKLEDNTDVEVEFDLDLFETVAALKYIDFDKIYGKPQNQWNRELLICDLIERFHITEAERFQFYEAWLDIEEHRKYQSDILLKFLHRFLVNNNDALFTECYETVKILDQIDFDTAHNILLHSSQAFVDLRQAYLTVIIHQCLFNRAEISSEYIENLASNMMSNFGFDLSQKFLGSLQNISNLSEFENILNFSKIYHIKSSDIYVKNATISILKRSLEIKLLGNQIEKVDRLKLGICLDDLLDKNWTFEQINHFFTIVKESNSREKARYFLSILEIISHYKISPKEENYEKILTILKNSTEDWQKEINKIAIEINFSDKGQIKMSKELVQELQSRNSQNENLKTLHEEKLLDLIEKIKSSNLLSLLFKNIIEEDSNLKNQIPSISISQWTKDHIRLWANMVKAYITHCIDTEYFIIEALAVIKQANFIDTGFHLTDAQILSCLIILNANKNQGRLLQVGTGEGKSTIISVLAVVYALLGSTVDIITSSPVLAERDAKEKENFYSMFDLQCSHNNDKAVYLSGPKVCYRKQIVYGEAAQFQFDTLRTEYAELNTLAGRKCDVAIVDEVDSMLIDDSSKIARLASTMSGMDQLQIIYQLLWHQLISLQEKIIRLDNKMYLFYGKIKFEEKLITLEYANEQGDIVSIPDLKTYLASTSDISNIGKYIPEDDKEDEFIKENLDNYIRIFIKENLKIPKNFSDFVHSQIPKWIDNAITALIYQENVHYIVHNGLIKPVDYYSTGIVQNSSNWSDGLHQFLQIKHELKMTSETFTTNFLSNRGYFTRYSSKLFGLTGTLGSDKAKQVLGDVYHVDFVIIPSLRQKQHLSLPDIIVMNEKDWLEEICHSAINESNKERGTLVICETIEHTKSIVEKLQQKYRSSAIKLYTMNDMNQEKNIANINPGEIIIATNLAGRGTDIKTEEIEKHGGLHVIVTFMPPNKRVEEQAFGRTSRQGKRGTSQRILNAINLIEYEDFDIQKITQFRDRIEAKMLCDFESCELKIITLKDELFIKFCSLLKEIRSKIREKISWWTNVKNNVKNTFVHVNPSVVESNTLLSIEEQWAMFLRKIDDEKFPINIEKIHADYEKFSENILSNYANDCVIKNPYHCINIGNDLIINDSSLTNQYNEAMKHFDKAIELDSNHCAAAFVGKGWLLIKGKEKFIGSNEQEFGYKEAAMRAFRRALEILAEEMALLTSIQTLLQKRSSFNINSPLSKQLVQKLNILGSYCNSLENFVNVIRKSRRLIQITDIIDSKNMKTDVDNSGVFKRVITHDEIEKGIGKWCNIRLISSDQSDRYEASIENCDEIGITKKDEDKFIVIYKHRIENKIAKWPIDDTQLNNWLLTVLFDESILDRNTNSKIYNRIYQKIVSENGYVRADFLAPLQTLSKDREYEVTFNDLTVREDMGTIDQAIETIDKAISKPNLLDRLSNTKRHILSTDYKDIRVSISQINSEILKELINPNIEVQEVTKEMALVQLKDKSSFFHRHLLPESFSPDSYAVNLDIILNDNKIQEESHLQVRNAIEIIEKQTEKNVLFNLTFISANEISKVLRTEIINISKLTVEFLCLNGEKIREKFTKIKSENINLNINLEIFDRKEQLLEVLRSLNIQNIELCTFQNEEKNVNNIKELVNKTIGKRKIEENKEDHICIKLIDLNTQTIDNILSICPNANFNIHFINIDFNSLLNGLNDESINIHFDRLGKETAQILIKQIRKKNLDFSLVFKHLKSTQAQRLIEIAPIDQENIEINKVKSLSELFMSDSKPDLELSEFSGRGIEYLLEISEKKFIPWLSVASVAILGVVQMAVGVALICTGFGATVGMGLITEGAADLLTAYRAYSTRQFSWSDYGKQKAVSLVISAVSMGFSSIKDAAKGAQTIVTGAGQELLEQAGTKLITSGKSAGTTLIKTGQNLKSLAIKFTGITVTEAVAREGLNKIADIGSNFVLEQMKPQISASIQNRVNSKFTESDLFKIIRKMYAIDLMSRKQQMKGKIHRIVIEIINPEHSFWSKQWDSIGGPLCKGMLSSVEKIRGPASMTIRILGTLNGMYEITFIIQNVHDKLLKKLTDIDRDTLSMYQVLNHYCTISKEDTKEILSLLDNEGIKEFNDELENKNFPNKLNTVDFKQFNIHKETIVKFFTSLHENILNVVIDDFNEIMKLVSDAITEQVFRITQSQLISPWSTYGMGELTKTISERIQDHFIVDKNQNSDSQNRENQENQEKGITLKGSEKYNTIAKQIRYNAKDYTIAYSQCEIIYHAQQQQDRSNIGIIDNKTRKYTEEVRTDKPASLSDMIALAAQQNLDIKIVDDPNYQPTNEDKEKGHYQLMLADGAVVDISSDRNNCGYSVIQKILHDRGIEKSIDDLRNDRAQRIEDNPKVFVKIFKAEQWVSSRYPQEANAILVIGAGYKYKKNIEFENIDKENIGKYRRRQRRPSSEGDSESENPNILYRAIREDEQPFEDGLRPPPNHDPNKSATSHIRSGTRAKQKSPWISATHSLKEAARWASVKEGRVVVFEIPQDLADQSDLPHESRTMYDLTNLNDARLIFPKGGPGLRSAESSQEVIIKDHIPPKCISTVYKVISVSKDEYEARKKEASSDVKFIKTKVPPPCANGKKDERSTYIILEKIEPQNKKS
ncbi:unnamed protein product [Rotaria sordida]|uniref:Protein translocase subunit SecA n=1 Tax=Rotaria sordida TaxID=392033 RepID=A0A819CKJ7_9BILA|nr:unnamed protein product [Rotaria sordida]